MEIAHVLLLISSYIFLFFVASIHSAAINEEFCTIEIESGRVRGKQNHTLFEEKPFYSFRGIPFAKPPIGNLRFKAPQKNDPWNGTLDAFEFGNDCVQSGFLRSAIFGNEDCLFINVYVPTKCSEMNSTNKLPVMFYIFGGQFNFGSASFYGPDFLMDLDVIVVTINYRTGPFGFLNLNLPEYSGNMGMKDQLLALKWVNQNIEYFGGDKNQVTLFGHSAGGVCVSLHMIQPESKRLFQRAIMMSGVALNPMLPTQFDQIEYLRNYFEVNSSNIVEFINEVDGTELCEKACLNAPLTDPGTIVTHNVYCVAVEGPDAIDPFLTQEPFDILTNESYESTIDAMYSMAIGEVVVLEEQKRPELIKVFDETFRIDLPLEKFQVNFSSEIYKNISKKVRDFYFDGEQITKEKLEGMHDLISDITFSYGSDLAARIQSKKSKAHTYFSSFAAQNDWNLSVRFTKRSNYTIKFRNHVDPVGYVWRFGEIPDEDYQNLHPNSLQRRLIKEISNFYANFAKFGNPMPDTEPLEFKALSSPPFNYYEITNEGISTKTNLKRDRMLFWDKFFDEYKHHWNITYNFQ